MKKHGAKPLRPVHAGGEVGHLDGTLTEITTTAAQRLKKWRTPLIALAIAVIAIQVGFFAVRGLNESKQVHLNQELFDLVQSPESRKGDYVLDPSRLEKLLAEVRGDPLEGYVYQAIVQFYLERAATLEDEATGRGSAIGNPAKADPAREAGTAGLAGKGVLEAFDRASTLAQEAASRLPADKDIQVWAGLVKAKIEEERKAPWSKAKRKYAPPDPGGAGAAPAVPGAAPAAEGKPEAPPPSQPAGGQEPAPADARAPEKGSG